MMARLSAGRNKAERARPVHHAAGARGRTARARHVAHKAAAASRCVCRTCLCGVYGRFRGLAAYDSLSPWPSRPALPGFTSRSRSRPSSWRRTPRPCLRKSELCRCSRSSSSSVSASSPPSLPRLASDFTLTCSLKLLQLRADHLQRRIPCCGIATGAGEEQAVSADAALSRRPVPPRRVGPVGREVSTALLLHLPIS